METVSLGQVGGEELALPPRVQEALGELGGSAKEGLLALSVGVALGVSPSYAAPPLARATELGSTSVELNAVRVGKVGRVRSPRDVRPAPW